MDGRWHACGGRWRLAGAAAVPGLRGATRESAAGCCSVPGGAVPGVAGVADARSEGCGRLGAPRLLWSTGMLRTEAALAGARVWVSSWPLATP